MTKINNKIGHIFLFISICIGLYLRLYDLGEASLWGDEFYHYLSAKYFLSNGTFELPSGYEYTRGWLYSLLVSLSFKLFGISELSARLPSVLWGILILPLIYYCARKSFNEKVAIISTLFISLSPWCVTWSRESRFYTQFQFFYLLLLFSSYYCFESLNLNHKISSLGKSRILLPVSSFVRKYNISIIWLIVAVIAFLVAALVHAQALIFCIALFVFCVIARLKSYGSNNQRYSFIILSIILMGILSFILNLNGILNVLKSLSISNFNVGVFLKIVYILGHHFYFLWVVLAVIGIFFSIKNKGNLGLYLTINLLIPFFIQIILLSFGWMIKARYFFYLYPVFILFLSFAIYTIANITARYIARLFYESGKIFRSISEITVMCLILLICIPLHVKDSFYIIKQVHGRSLYVNFTDIHPNWKKAANYLINKIEESDLIFTTQSLFPAVYLNNPAYFLREPDFKKIAYRIYVDSQGNARDEYSGLIFLSDFKQFINLLAENHKGYIIVSNEKFTNYYIDHKIVHYIKNNFEIVLQDETVTVYNWRFVKNKVVPNLPSKYIECFSNEFLIYDPKYIHSLSSGKQFTFEFNYQMIDCNKNNLYTVGLSLHNGKDNYFLPSTFAESGRKPTEEMFHGIIYSKMPENVPAGCYDLRMSIEKTTCNLSPFIPSRVETTILGRLFIPNQKQFNKVHYFRLSKGLLSFIDTDYKLIHCEKVHNDSGLNISLLSLSRIDEYYIPIIQLSKSGINCVSGEEKINLSTVLKSCNVIYKNSDDYDKSRWQKCEVIREKYEVDLLKHFCGEYEVKMVMTSKNREQNVKVEKGELYLLTFYNICGGRVCFNKEDSVESLNLELGIKDLQGGKWILEFIRNDLDTLEIEGVCELGVVINKNEIIKMVVNADKETEKISVDIPGKMLKEGKNHFDFVCNHGNSNGDFVIQDIKLVNKKRIVIDDNNYISLGKVRLGEWKEKEGGQWENPYHMVTRAGENGRELINGYTFLTTRDYGKMVSQRSEEDKKSGGIILAAWDVRGNRVSLKWRLEDGIVSEDLQFVIRVEGGGKRYTQRYFPQKSVSDWKEGENYWEDYGLVVPESDSKKTYKVNLALWDPIKEKYLRLNDKKGFIYVGETRVINEEIPDGILLEKSKEPFFFDETTLEAKVIDQLKSLRVKKLKDFSLKGRGLDSLKSYDMVVADRVVSEEERRLLDEYVEAGGVVVESRDRPRGEYIWELRESG